MSITDEYTKIPYDLSGATSKNRFRLEMLWGASKMFDLFDKDDFCIVFDYKCDIEVHSDTSLEFYQVKTHKIQSPYTFSMLSKLDKTNKSIIGKLFLLKNAVDPTAPVKVAIVSNAYLKIGDKVYAESENLDFASLDSKTQQAIRKALKGELGSTIDLNNVGYIYTSMNLISPDDDLRGKIVGSFEKIMGCEPQKPNALYRLIKDTVMEKRQLERIHEEVKGIQKKKEISEGMYEKVTSSIRDVSYTQSLELLKRDVERTKEQYISIANALSKTRTNLIELRNERAEILASLDALKLLDRDNEKQIKALNNHVCPFCSSSLDDTVALRISKYNTSEDIILLSNNMQITISDIERKIYKQEIEYQKWLDKLKKYEESLAEKHGEIDDVLAHKGFIEIKDEIIRELHILREKIDELTQQEKTLKAEERTYIEIKNRINTRYYELMMIAKNQFNLEEIKDKSFEKITNSFKGGGSNKPIATVIWYINLLKLRKEFNPSAIDFPVVFDSPNNAETDMEKKGQLYKYIVDNTPKDNQLIVSGIGYENEHTFGIAFDKVIYLDNEKYHLLCNEDYNTYSSILKELCSK